MKRLIENKRVMRKYNKSWREITAKARFEPLEYRLVTNDYLLYHLEMMHYRLVQMSIADKYIEHIYIIQ